VVIGAEPIPLEHLRHIQAREHHVHVTLAGSDLIQRARLADIVAQTGPQDGIQPHRSWWVAAHAAKTLERDGQKHVLTLHDGTKVPVARSRLDAVRDWMAHHDPQVVDQSGV
jgi:DNA-binding LytR/AlgR family response regulator